MPTSINSNLFWTWSQLPDSNTAPTIEWAKYALNLLRASVDIAKTSAIGLVSLRDVTKSGVSGILLSVGLDKQADSLFRMADVIDQMLTTMISPDSNDLKFLALGKYTVKAKRYYPDQNRENTIRYQLDEYNPFLRVSEKGLQYADAVLVNVNGTLQQMKYQSGQMGTVGVVVTDAFVTKAGDWPLTGNDISDPTLPTDQNGWTVVLTEDAVHAVIGKLLDFANACYTMMTTELLAYVEKNPNNELPVLPSPPPTVADVNAQLPPPPTGTATKTGATDLPVPPTQPGTSSSKSTGPSGWQVAGAIALAALVGVGTWKITGAMIAKPALNPAGVPASKQVPKGQIDFIVGNMSVGTPDDEVRENVEKRARAVTDSKSLIKACGDYAVKVHHKNQKMYGQVMGGHFRNPSSSKPLVDDNIYTLIGPNGYRYGPTTLALARSRGLVMLNQMKQAGWAGNLDIYYRDGSFVERVKKNPSSETNRPRRIVKLAASKTKVKQLKTWLTNDEQGAWEREAKNLLERTSSEAKNRGLTEDQVDDQLSTYLAYLGAEALVRSKKSVKKSR